MVRGPDKFLFKKDKKFGSSTLKGGKGKLPSYKRIGKDLISL